MMVSNPGNAFHFSTNRFKQGNVYTKILSLSYYWWSQVRHFEKTSILMWDHLVMEINWLQYLFQEFMVRSLCSVYFNPKRSQGIHVRSTQKKENMNNSFDKMVSISKLVAIYLLVQHPAVFLQKTRLLLQTLFSQYYILTHVTDT